jgi:hypothetical protein
MIRGCIPWRLDAPAELRAHGPPKEATMTNKILTLKNAGRLTCTWIRTGDARTPLACVWAAGNVRSGGKEASPRGHWAGRMERCA